jgi:hypothetical protein
MNSLTLRPTLLSDLRRQESSGQKVVFERSCLREIGNDCLARNCKSKKASKKQLDNRFHLDTSLQRILIQTTIDDRRRASAGSL